MIFCTVQSRKGSSIITAMLFNVVLTLLVLSMLEKNLLDRKISGYFENSSLAFIKAEKALLAMENKLKNGEMPKNAEVISSDICGVTFYKLISTGKSGIASKTIQSTFAKTNDISKCTPKPLIIEGRQSWKECD